MSKRALPIVLGMVIVVALGVFYFMVDPESSRFVPQCTLYRLTGIKCPGCGSQRMLHALLHGDLAAAWGYNAFLLCALPVIALYIAAATFRPRLPRLYMALNSTRAIIIICVLISAWTLLRNCAL